ncbi:ABC transporter permease [Knoellia aerolata]|uniref:ABC transporter permease n=1 Tax=Knoellia aerolata DSM 18566 TaxID=1385519 RepID=A0A0A0JWK1_9MICO|nr:ABC transporter permease subunit [Knoellia aerolata]KGN41568.1 ABC transporter permease [Knoellia aerolata DSM 18566]
MRGHENVKEIAGSAGLALVALVVWQVASGLTFVIPTPVETLRVLVANLGDPAYLTDVRATAVAVVSAFTVGTVLGGIMGLVLGLSRWARLIFEPLVIALNGVPKIVLYPILLPIFQLSGSKVVMGILFALFPVLINVATGVREVPAVYWKLGRSVQASRVQMLLHIILPTIRRPLLTGIRLAASLAVVGVVLSEFFATRRGLGRVVLQSYGHGDYAEMVATILLLIVVSFTVSIMLWRWEKRIR